jgi:hypothetical protein
MNTRSDAIAALNDELRSSFSGGHVLKTAGVEALDPELQSKIIDAVRAFADFSTDNDPRGEHDFGSIEIEGVQFFWKIDYYQKGSHYSAVAAVPEDNATTDRVLTIMLASEY